MIFNGEESFLTSLLDHWGLILTFLTGFLTVSAVVDKLGLRELQKSHKELEQHHNKGLVTLMEMQLRNDYENHDFFNAWTAPTCDLNSKLYKAYVGLGGNGLPAVWAKKQANWDIVSDKEMLTKKMQHMRDKVCDDCISRVESRMKNESFIEE